MSKSVFKDQITLIQTVEVLNILLSSMIEKKIDLEFEFKFKLQENGIEFKDGTEPPTRELCSVATKENILHEMIGEIEGLINHYEIWIDLFTTKTK